MPHYTNYGGTTQLSVQPEKEGFGSFEPREAKFQEASTNYELTGRKGLNWSELCDVGTSLRQSDDFIKLGDIKGDRHFTTGGGGDSITGEGRSTKIWTNGGASTFNANDTVVFETGLPVDGLYDSVHYVSDTPCLGGKTHLTETYEPIAEMYSFGESLNPALEIGGTAGPGGTSFMTGNIGIPTNIIGSSASPGGDYI